MPVYLGNFPIGVIQGYFGDMAKLGEENEMRTREIPWVKKLMGECPQHLKGTLLKQVIIARKRIEEIGNIGMDFEAQRLIEAFVWEESPQGNNFWSGINQGDFNILEDFQDVAPKEAAVAVPIPEVKHQNYLDTVLYREMSQMAKGDHLDEIILNLEFLGREVDWNETVDAAFGWHGTPQGTDYWGFISDGQIVKALLNSSYKFVGTEIMKKFEANCDDPLILLAIRLQLMTVKAVEPTKNLKQSFIWSRTLQRYGYWEALWNLDFSKL